MASLLDTHGLDAPNSRAIARQLMELSQDPDNQPFIAAERGCLAGLVGYVVHPDAEVALMGARTLEFLSGHPQNKKLMKEFPGLIDAVAEAYARGGDDGANVNAAVYGGVSLADRTKEFAGKTLRNLGVALREDASSSNRDAWWHGASATSNTSSSFGEPSSTNDENAAPDNRSPSHTTTTPVKPTASSASNAAARKYFSLTLHVDGLEDNGTAMVAQRVLLNVKGVISVSLQREKSQAVVGTRGDELTMDELCDALSRAGLSATSWPPPPPPTTTAATSATSFVNESSAGADASPAAKANATSSNNAEDSGYLNEADYSTESFHEGTIARWGVSSLEARLAEQRREEELRQQKTERLITKVSSIVSSAGSWLMGW